MFYTAAKVAKMFNLKGTSAQIESEIKELITGNEIPEWRKGRGGWGWDSEHIVAVGRKLTSLRRPSRPLVISVFVTKGGVLKTTLSLNLARWLALNDVKTLVLGLDLQGDITSALGHTPAAQSQDLKSALEELDHDLGLYDYFSGQTGLTDLAVKTDLETLDLIPETPELIALDQELLLKPRREYWLKEKVTTPLLKNYDVILIDCSPNWNQLITNALVASDLLISPVECRINNYRNLKMFRALVEQCRQDLNLKFQHLYVPTRLNQQRRLSREINQWYNDHLPQCLSPSVRESTAGEEATALNLSVIEYSPDSDGGAEMKSICNSIFNLATSGRIEVSHQGAQLWP